MDSCTGGVPKSDLHPLTIQDLSEDVAVCKAAVSREGASANSGHCAAPPHAGPAVPALTAGC